MEDAPCDLAHEWESCSLIRSRFRRVISFVQFPVTPAELVEKTGEIEKNGEEDDLDFLKRPVCTKGLEMNADALLCMLDHYSGNFIDVYKLQSEVLHACHDMTCKQVARYKHACAEVKLYMILTVPGLSSQSSVQL